MAAVQQQAPTPERQKRSASFMESMEEEMRRVAEHLERRNRRVAYRSSHKAVNGFSMDGRRGYSFSESIGHEAGARRTPIRRPRINKSPRQFSTNTLPNRPLPEMETEPDASPRPPTPLSAPPEGSEAPLELPEDGEEEATDLYVQTDEKEASQSPVSVAVADPVPEVVTTAVTLQSPSVAMAEPPMDSLPAEDAPHDQQSPETVTTSPPPPGMNPPIPRIPTPETDSELKVQQSTAETKSIAEQSRGDDPKDTTAESLQLSTKPTTAESLQLSTKDTTAESLQLSTKDTTAESLQLSTKDTTAESLQFSTKDTTAESLQLSTKPTTAESLQLSTKDTTAESLQLSTKDTSVESFQLSTPEVKSVPVKPPTKHNRSPIPDVAMKPQRDDHRHSTITKHELRSAPESKIHITVSSSSVDKSHRHSELSSLVMELQAQLREKEEEMKVLQRRHDREAKEKEEQMKKMTKENHRLEREKWELLKRARDAAERSLHLRTQLDLKEGSFRAAQIELERSRDELVSVKSANTSLRSLLSDLRAPRSSVDMAVQVDLGGGTLRRNRSIELALTQGLSEDIDSGVERSGEFRMSSSTIGETWSERWDREMSIGSSIFEQESREHTPVVTPTATPSATPTPTPTPTPISTPAATPQLTDKKAKKKKPALFSKIRKSTGKRGSVDGLDLSRSSLIQGRGTPISFPYSAITQEMQAHWRVLDEFRSVPFSQWNLKALIAWMEAGIGMGQYTAAVREHVTSGQAMLSLTDSDLEKKLGIANILHRRKLRLAIEEQRGVASACRYPYASKIDYSWIANEWVADIGLPHLTDLLSTNLVDGRVLNSLSKEDLKKHFRMVKKSEQLSFLSGVELLRMHEFNREAIQEHRRNTRNPLYWTNRDVCDWLKDIHLEDYAAGVLGSGVHGALLFLERSHFTSEQLANILNISGSKLQLRRHLATKLSQLFSEDFNESCAELGPSFNSSPVRLRSPSVPLPDCPHPARMNSLNHGSPSHGSPSHSSPKNLSPPTPQLPTALNFHRTSSHPNFAERQRMQTQERVRLSLRESALRSVSLVREEHFVRRSVTPTPALLNSNSSTTV